MSTTPTVPTTSNTTNSRASIFRFNIEHQCPIQHVTVYQDRAEVTRLIRHHFDVEGIYDLILEGFSPFVDSTSVCVKGGTRRLCTILEVSYQAVSDNTTSPVELTLLDELKNELDEIESDIDFHQRELVRLDKQRTWLDGRALKVMHQDGQMNDLDTIEEFMTFYHRSLSKLDDHKTNEENQIKRLTQQRDRLAEKITAPGTEELSSHHNERREMNIRVHIERNNLDVNLEVSYLISNCSWRPCYDVRVNSSETLKNTTQLTYYGVILNKSRECWSDTQLSLSTTSPSLEGIPPKLPTLKINFYRPCQRYYELDEPDDKKEDSCSTSEPMLADLLLSRQLRKPKIFITSQDQSSVDSNKVLVEDEQETPSVINFSMNSAKKSTLSAIFTIPTRSTIKADGKPHRVIIGILDFTSTFIYTIIPKLSIHAYLKVSTINTSDKQLLAGRVAVFMDNNFITHSSIDDVHLGGKFDLPLGTDGSIKVEYQPVKKVIDTQGLISKTFFENVRHEIRLFNTKSTEVIAFVYEQVPLSLDERIKVKLVVPDLRIKDSTPAFSVAINNDNNLQWKCVIQAKSECRLPVEYILEWPTDKSIELREDSG